MTMRLRWLPSQSASGLHAASALARGERLVDGQLAAALEAPAASLRREILAARLPEARFWRMACALSTTFDNSRQLAKMAIYRSTGQSAVGEMAERLGERIADVEAVVNEHRPDLMQELSLRARPLREQWEARGPGLLNLLFQSTDPRLQVDAADVILVLPVLGGGGEAQLQNNSVRIEAVLANPHDKLPEVLRLGWMLAQLHLDLPHYAQEIAVDRLPLLAALAMIPVTLSAAEQVELVHFDDHLVRLAIEAWHVPLPENGETVDALMRWWDAYDLARPPFDVAFRTLDEMLN